MKILSCTHLNYAKLICHRNLAKYTSDEDKGNGLITWLWLKIMHKSVESHTVVCTCWPEPSDSNTA